MTERKPIKEDPKPKKVRASKDTPPEVIDMMNKKYQEWKTTKQVSYDKDGNRLQEENKNGKNKDG